jgi:hypothetical protein
MAVIRENQLGDCDACPINPSKDPYKSNISIPLTNYYQTHEGRKKMNIFHENREISVLTMKKKQQG